MRFRVRSNPYHMKKEYIIQWDQSLHLLIIKSIPNPRENPLTSDRLEIRDLTLALRCECFSHLWLKSNSCTWSRIEGWKSRGREASLGRGERRERDHCWREEGGKREVLLLKRGALTFGSKSKMRFQATLVPRMEMLLLRKNSRNNFIYQWVYSRLISEISKNTPNFLKLCSDP